MRHGEPGIALLCRPPRAGRKIPPAGVLVTGVAITLLFAAGGRSEIIDRIAVTVGNSVITESGIYRDLRLAALLNGDKPDFSPESRRQMADRLVEQAIIRQEMNITRYQGTNEAGAREALDQVKQERFNGNENAYRAALKEYRVTETELLRYLARQADTLQFIELRFRPEVQLSETEIRDYYEKEFLPEWRKENPGKEPSFDDLRSEAEDALAARRVDALVEKWMKQARMRVPIRYREDAFQ